MRVILFALSLVVLLFSGALAMLLSRRIARELKQIVASGSQLFEIDTGEPWSSRVWGFLFTKEYERLPVAYDAFKRQCRIARVNGLVGFAALIAMTLALVAIAAKNQNQPKAQTQRLRAKSNVPPIVAMQTAP